MKMKRRTRTMKRTGCLMAALCMLFLECASVGATELPVNATVAPLSGLAQADELSKYDEDGDGFVYGIVQTSESLLSNGVSTLAYNGEVIENGVRLRNKPSTSGTILELMYKGESVRISLSNSVSGWYFLKRIKTGTWGYASSKCILYI